MPKNLKAERKYIIESKVDEWDGRLFRWLARKYWTVVAERMAEGDVLKLYHEMVEDSRPLAWLNGGVKNVK